MLAHEFAFGRFVADEHTSRRLDQDLADAAKCGFGLDPGASGLTVLADGEDGVLGQGMGVAAAYGGLRLPPIVCRKLSMNSALSSVRTPLKQSMAVLCRA